MAYSPPKIATDGFRSSAQWSSAQCQGHERNSVLHRAASVRLLCIFALCFPLSSLAERSCDEWQAEIVSVQGTVEIQTPEGWQAVEDGAKICTGYAVRVHGFSRAAIRLPDKTMLRLDQDTSVTFSEPGDDTGSWLDVLRGVIHVISRDPRALRFNTPYANAGLEGTEFVIAVNDEQTDVTVLEGEVLLSNSAGAIGVPSGERGSARLAQKPTSETVSDAVDAVHWTPYYVPILGRDLPAADQTPATAESQTAQFYSRRAARRLSVGRVAEAQDDLKLALSIEAAHAESMALQALIALAHQEIAKALDLTARATNGSPRSAAAWLASSYAAEADFDLRSALASASMATTLAPQDGFARARLAELQLATGDHAGALESAEIASALQPELPHALTVLGFARLSGRSSSEAAASFRDALALDPAAPLPRLGLGLALVRQGHLEEAREQIEIAVVLDPTDTLSRSYMAKIYGAEHRGELSASQLELAKALGTRDPTPWFYDALRKQSENRPVEALRDLRTAIDLNDSHAVYRSRMMIDEDLAARSAGVGSLHSTLGFEQLALLEGWKSVAANPADYSGHRLLADVYSHLPRHQIARVNELYQSQLLQPLNITPIRPQLAEANLFILDTMGPSALAFDEFQPLVQANGLSYQGSAVAAGNGTRGADVAVAGLYDRVSYSVGRFEFETDGFRSNNDLDQQVTSAFVQVRPNHDTSILTELRSSEIDTGDLHMFFDPGAYSRALRQKESVDSLRLGLRRSLSERSTLLGTVIAQDAEASFGFDDDFRRQGDRSGYSVDVQHLHDGDGWHLSTGARYLNESLRDIVEIASPTPAPPFGESSMQLNHELKHSTVYAYGNITIGDGLTTIIGASIDRVDGQEITRNRFNPKIGVIWEPSRRTTVRAVAFRTLQGPFVSKFNILPSLEPTHVAGFNQQFFGSEGEEAWRYGVALDYQFSESLYTGVELSRRDLEVPTSSFLPDSPVPILQFPEVWESLGRAYLYWTPSTQLSASAAYQYEKFDNGGTSLSDGLLQVRTHRLPLELNYFHRSGFSAGATATYVDQAGDFSPMTTGPNPVSVHGEDRFWIMDLSLGYRLQSRRGQISLNVHNALDQDFRFQDTDPENPRLLSERMVLMKVTLSY